MKTVVRIFAFALAVAFASLDVSMEGSDLTTLTFRVSTPAEAVIGHP